MKKNKIHHYNSGFTFIEMALVLIIIGFIMGVVGAAKSLIDSARVTSIIAEKNTWNSVYGSFQLRYSAKPGDMPEAFLYWGALAGCTDANVNTTPAGCNGDGNNKIGDASDFESVRAWQHLYLSGALTINYRGVIGTTADAYVDKTQHNVPKSELKGGAWWIDNVTIYGVDKDALTFARLDSGNVNKGIITPAMAEKIDLKIDDGLADDGDTLVIDGDSLPAGSDCVTGVAGVKPASFVKYEDDFACRIIFLLN